MKVCVYTHAHCVCVGGGVCVRTSTQTHARTLTRPQNQDKGFSDKYDKSTSAPVTKGKVHT